MPRKPKDTTQKQRTRIPGGVTGKGFIAGDPRINRLGRPKGFDELRELAREIAALEVDAGGQKVSRVTAILMALSSDKKHMREFLEYAFGRVPQAVDVTSGGEKLIIEIVRKDTPNKNDNGEDSSPQATPETASDPQ